MEGDEIELVREAFHFSLARIGAAEKALSDDQLGEKAKSDDQLNGKAISDDQLSEKALPGDQLGEKAKRDVLLGEKAKSGDQLGEKVKSDVQLNEKAISDDQPREKAKCDDLSAETEEGDIIKPKATGMSEVKKKKRVLPDWMQEKSPQAKKTKLSKEEPKTKVNSRYLENIKFITGEEAPSGEAREAKKLDHCPFEDDDEGDEILSQVIEVEQEKTETLPEAHEDQTDCSTPGPSKIAAASDEEQFAFPILVTKDDIEDNDEPKNLGKLPNVNSVAATNTTEVKPKRPSCGYGATCYRKNPAHRTEEAHPGDEDFRDPDQADDDEDDEDDGRPECEYGRDCYRKNPEHRKDFKHSVRKARKAKVAAKKKGAARDADDYESDFIDDDEEDGWEPVDDSDADADFQPSSEVGSQEPESEDLLGDDE